MTAKKHTVSQTTSEHANKPRKTKATKTKTVSVLVAAPPPAEPAPTEPTETAVAPMAQPLPSVPVPPTNEPGAAPAAAALVQSPQTKKRSALEAAVRVLAETGQAMSCPELITAMAAKGYWSSPKGKTPASTLYASFLRELQTKGENARFLKSERGKFRLKDVV
jgi:hypothetical protein